MPKTHCFPSITLLGRHARCGPALPGGRPDQVCIARTVGRRPPILLHQAYCSGPCPVFVRIKAYGLGAVPPIRIPAARRSPLTLRENMQ
ncbi:hypothetical protein WJ0W_001892 [Paenibacillus melissococcoides]|uniref:Uncharacterized protein n=1 Tax=Paenibacillus melissococcoides TaxID=2912268 RepID=A0ABN8U4G7_9BACL|nr:hypothetical protein WJ0W_001892 [Paenibacillus melissococcoides]